MNTKKDQPAGTPKDTHYAKLRRAHRDQKRQADKSADDPTVKLYGLHTVREAILNPARQKWRLLVTRNALPRLQLEDAVLAGLKVDMVEPKAIAELLDGEAVHQGALLEAMPLKPEPLSRLSATRLILILDQVTDPHNVGAIIRSAVAFGAGALITTNRHSPTESGVLAKAASGALEHIHHITVRNLADAIEELKEIGFQTIGLDSDGPEQLEDTFAEQRIALVLGAEGKGLRQKTRMTVDALARLDVPGTIRSLNVSNATAISLYAAHRHLSSDG
ncbi:23S rRNA (guanosine(2251)-2'-O)-methyltransferase RlmB [Notoacmeibacter ruber]|uniref:23S rRNA (Guanosine(2251)-2'-O)-methyltransferase RlmB n=1 Tax=Notoacmeibacter ruber TaxID=2670375 RepID=A0A3L7JBF8_9HYPH|nr:23S rRNA (guanosine(2251)-2'-O)-methyltransferase RlmB [Notoacmeibacter ruber]RLQ87784.1 23S rRNA (guanosine(2251)-2'-O)-methyltransferase RlmB [Notoacmeibacter ruber]